LQGAPPSPFRCGNVGVLVDVYTFARESTVRAKPPKAQAKPTTARGASLLPPFLGSLRHPPWGVSSVCAWEVGWVKNPPPAGALVFSSGGAAHRQGAPPPSHSLLPRGASGPSATCGALTTVPLCFFCAHTRFSPGSNREEVGLLLRLLRYRHGPVGSSLFSNGRDRAIAR
jgi:hypothetical protein